MLSFLFLKKKKNALVNLLKAASERIIHFLLGEPFFCFSLKGVGLSYFTKELIL